MKILVTGGLGFIGSNLIKKLIKENHQVTCLDNLYTGTLENKVDGCSYILDDCLNIDTLNQQFDVIYHLGAVSRVQPSFENPVTTFKYNVEGTVAICEYALKHNIKRLVYAGSSSKWHNPSDSPYAMYKYLGEEVCKLYKQTYGLNVEIARFYNVYGPGESVGSPWSSVIGIWRGQIQKNQPITIVGDGEQRRDFTHIDDIVSGLCLIGESNHMHTDAWELGTGINYSINELYQIFYNKFNIIKNNIPDQKGNYRETLRINTDAVDLLGWCPQDRLKDYIESLVF
jgi:UDP-glucose 4-epimerase